MMFMNTWEISDAAERWAEHPILGPATQTLVNLRDAADDNSDGWAYWPKPARAARSLMTLIQRGNADATPATLKTALRPIKAFRTRSMLAFEIVDAVAQRDPDGGFSPAEAMDYGIEIAKRVKQQSK